MREQPPSRLVELLEQLGLATAAGVRKMRHRVRRLASDLPCFESVWVDALAQARILTRLQAIEINAGRGAELRVGPFVVYRALQWPQYANSFLARRIDGGDFVRLLVTHRSGPAHDKLISGLGALAVSGARLRGEHIVPITEVGEDGGRLWAAAPWIEGRSAARWVAHNGRFPPQVVLHVAQCMVAILSKLEETGQCHGDLSTAGLIFTEASDVVLLQPGLRAIFRPEEGYAHADLPPAAYDYLAPERVADGSEPNTASDMFACGCVWWHLLCGRAPLSGGSSLAKLRSVQEAKIPDVRRFAPELPEQLAVAIMACLRKSPDRRPGSMARLADTLGPPTRNGKRALARCLGRRGRGPIRRASSLRAAGRGVGSGLRIAAAAAALAVVAAVAWPIWQGRVQLPPANIPTGTANDQTSQPQDLLPNRPRSPGPLQPMEDKAGKPDNSEPDNSEPDDMVLACGGPLVVESLKLREGQTVRGEPGGRPLLMVPRDGLIVEGSAIRFQNIDFLWDHEHLDGDAGSGAVVELRANRAEFHGCSFSCARRSTCTPVAVRWGHSGGGEDLAMSHLAKSHLAKSLPSGRLRMRDCVLRGISAGIDCRRIGAITVEADNCLRLGGGPLLRLDHCPRADEPVVVALSRVTLRGGGALLACRYERAEERPGEIAIHASRCALIIDEGQPLLLLDGPTAAEQLLRGIYWTGDGSLLSPRTTIAAWKSPQGKLLPLDEASISMAGLVRSAVEFAGQPGAGPAASRITHWQAPLHSTDPPGMDPGRTIER